MQSPIFIEIIFPMSKNIASPEIKTDVAIGATDGFRYIAVKPPLNDAEVELLVDRGLIGSSSGHVERVTLGPNCTMLRGGWNTERAQVAAKEITSLLKTSRGNVSLHTNPVDIQGYQSTPFNPVTR